MTPERYQRVSEIFEAAFALSAPERERLINLRCGDDEALRRDVTSYLADAERHSSYLECSPFEQCAADAVVTALTHKAHDPLIGCRIGDYTIESVIGAGGMGTVYRATQERPARTVALKLMNAGATSRTALRRFGYESQILARLRHPGIAEVYQAGVQTLDGAHTPFFAMELIEGENIVTYAERAQLTLAERVRLIADACEAVHHGHQKGVIHRDLKPDNILINRDGRPKIIDFGIARVTQSGHGLVTCHTEAGQLVGTLSYMSPEQCGGDGDVDTRSDVYALGVVLYRLVCGRLPYDLRDRSIVEAARMIRQDAPTEPASVVQDISADLATIMLKSLRKFPADRYGSAADLAADLHRYLEHRPIEARRPNVVHQVRLFARREPAKFVGAATALTLLMLCVVVSAVFALSATRAARRAMDARVESERVTAFLGGMLEGVNPHLGGSVRVTNVLDDAHRRASIDLRNQPAAMADVEYTIARTYAGLWMWDDAARHAAVALGLYRRTGGERTEDAGNALTLLGRAHTFLHRSDSVRLQLEALDIRREVYGPRHSLVAETLGNLAFAKWSSGLQPRYNEAEAHYRDAIEMFRTLDAPISHEWARTTFSYAAMLSSLDRTPSSLEYFEEALRLFRELQPAPDGYTIETLRGYAEALLSVGRGHEVEPLLIEIYENAPPAFMPDRNSKTMELLAGLKLGRFEFADAENALRASLAYLCHWCASQRDDPTRWLYFADRLNRRDDLVLEASDYAEVLDALVESRMLPAERSMPLILRLAKAVNGRNPRGAAELLEHSLALHEPNSRITRRLHKVTLAVLERIQMMNGLVGRPGEVASAN